MVIQSNMTPKDIVEVWEVTTDIFKKYNVSLTKQTLETLIKEEQLALLLQELNFAVGSSTATCIEGG
ncbi:hypothetical protein [Cytobacillus praedii]|uniref:Uncharacterized protein n=1 Tax=Cytobacillus praedii TaxID=1742358 RepID=A0A4R1ASM6_9BACI|nr:hypothetical protein [Cytobacillus praedii]TCJ01097.1 hypothetical protein E0Y62_25730 [Cytobacillus praedii]